MNVDRLNKRKFVFGKMKSKLLKILFNLLMNFKQNKRTNLYLDQMISRHSEQQMIELTNKVFPSFFSSSFLNEIIQIVSMNLNPNMVQHYSDHL